MDQISQCTSLEQDSPPGDSRTASQICESAYRRQQSDVLNDDAYSYRKDWSQRISCGEKSPRLYSNVRMRSATANSETHPNALPEVRNDSQRAVRGRGHSRLLGDDLDSSRLKGRGCMNVKD